MADAPGLPEPYAHHVIWHGKDPADPGWQQYHDGSDPMPAKWDDDAPDEVIALYTADQLLTVRPQALEPVRELLDAASNYANRYAQDEACENGPAYTGCSERQHEDAKRLFAAIRALAGKGEA